MTKFAAIYNGAVIGTRTSDRPYTHAVIGRRIEAVDRAYAYGYEASKVDRSNFECAAFIAAQQPGARVQPPGWKLTTSYSAERIAEAQEEIAGGFEAYIAGRRQAEIDNFERRLASGAYEPRVIGWSMSRAGANRMASGAKGGEILAIVPAAAA